MLEKLCDTKPGKSRRPGEGVGFDRIRRITGYLVGTLERFNDAKRREEADRVKHASNDLGVACGIKREFSATWPGK